MNICYLINNSKAIWFKICTFAASLVNKLVNNFQKQI